MKNSLMDYVVTQLVKAVPLILTVSIITFFLAKVSGLNPVDACFDSELTASSEQRVALVNKWELDQPTIMQLGL